MKIKKPFVKVVLLNEDVERHVQIKFQNWNMK
jgi:hypothetical protein